MRVANLHTASIDGIAPGAEGDLPDCPPVRALVDAGLLRLVSAGGPSAIAYMGDTADVLRARFDQAWSEREAEHHAAFARLRAEMAVERAFAADSASQVEALRAELAALKAKPSKSSKTSKSSDTDPTPDAPPPPAEG